MSALLPLGSVLNRAIHEGRDEEVVSLLASGSDPDAHDENGHTPLTMAAQMRRVSIVDHLLRAGGNVSIRHTDSYTALHYAVRGMCDEAVVALLNAGADMDAVDSAGNSPLSLTIANGYRPIFQILMEAGAAVNTISGYNDRTPLHIAVENYEGDAEDGCDILRALLGASANTTVLDKHGDTPLSLAMAAQPDHVEIVDTLLKGGASANLVDGNGTPPLHFAISTGCENPATSLLLADADVNTLDAEGNCPLAIAVLSSESSIPELLLAAGADPNIRHRNGSTPLHYAVGGTMTMRDGGATRTDEGGLFEEIVSLLLNAGADAAAVNGDGQAPADLLYGDEKNAGARLLLLRASAWPRRGWVVMLRARSGAVGGDGSVMSVAVEFLRGDRLPDGVFCTVVSFL